MNPLRMLAISIESEDNRCYSRVYLSFSLSTGKVTNALPLWRSEYVFLHLQSGDVYLLAKTRFYTEQFQNSLSILHIGKSMPFSFPSMFLKMMPCIFISLAKYFFLRRNREHKGVNQCGCYQSVHIELCW